MSIAGITDALVALQVAVDDVLKYAANGDFGNLPDDEFVDAAHEVEAIRRQLCTADQSIVAEVERRGLPQATARQNAAGHLSALWHITRAEANSRVREAAALAPRTTLTGDLLPPMRPHTARARQLGVLSTEQVAVILRALDRLPSTLHPADVEAAEVTLVDLAHTLDARDLRRAAGHLQDVLDPDGAEPSEKEQQAKRFLDLREEADGMVSGSFRLDGETGARALAYFEGPASAPRPTDAGGRDERSAAQRRHDAFADLLALAQRASELTPVNGPSAVVHVSMTAEQFEAGTGLVHTSHGQRLSVAQALRLADQAVIAWVVHNSTGGILDYGRARRCATPQQAEALFVRDGGCAFPGCSIPAEWCERHHVIEWATGGVTSLDNMVTMCPYHHRRFTGAGWCIEFHDGVPWFIPPRHIDPQQNPIRNIRGLAALEFT
jgi:Domain of unknown function (DUF222)/HNH endonuclease